MNYVSRKEFHDAIEIILRYQEQQLQTLIIDSVNSCLKHHKEAIQETTIRDEILNVTQAANFLSLAKPTIYALTSKRILPHMKRGKKLYFNKSELDVWIKSGKRSTTNEIENPKS